ncbi:hypothetical protein FHT44_003260 [Mycolicibacterium sp. BK634]|nr:hypothetical protein [Mycolicibacterium sp. BK634]MBB3750765.1 hypothetical protein [Mycolicibacterium sp. BK634]
MALVDYSGTHIPPFQKPQPLASAFQETEAHGAHGGGPGGGGAHGGGPP